MVTLKDISLRVNRSITTVSRALAGYSDVSDETITLVRTAAREMGYVPNTIARRLRSKSTETIGFVIPESSGGYSEAFFNEFLAGVSKTASMRGYDLLVAVANDPKDELSAYKKLIREGKVDGFILNRTYRVDPRVEFLLQEAFPFAMFGRVDKPGSIPYVDEDGDYAMGLIVKHLVNCGHTRIACIGQPQAITFSYTRLQSVEKHLKQLGHDLQPEMVRMGYFNQKEGYEQTNELLCKPHPPTAIICFNDLIAFGAINAAKDLGFTIGKDIAITGFDDIPMAAQYRPPLTTIFQPIQSIGGMVVDLLIDYIRTIKEESENASAIVDKNRITLPVHWEIESSHQGYQLLLKPELIIRETTL